MCMHVDSVAYTRHSEGLQMNWYFVLEKYVQMLCVNELESEAQARATQYLLCVIRFDDFNFDLCVVFFFFF